MARRSRQEIPKRFHDRIPTEVAEFYTANLGDFRAAPETMWEITDRGNVVIIWGSDIFRTDLDDVIDMNDEMFTDLAPPYISFSYADVRLAFIQDPRL